MDLINESAWSAHLFRGALDDDTIYATLAVRATYVIDEGDRAIAVETQAPVRVKLEEEQGEPIEDDGAPAKGGVDVCIMGNAVSRRGPVIAMMVNVQVGEVARSVRVAGDRRWVLQRGVDVERAVQREGNNKFDFEALVMSSPEPFETMPMAWGRAYGGEAPAQDGKVMYPPNPVGRGYLVTLKDADGTPLPNLEDPAQPVVNWRDWPLPVALSRCPRSSKLRVDRGIQVAADERNFQVLPGYYNVAHPWLLFPEIAPETPIAVEGMSASGRFQFHLPTPPLEVEISLEDRRASLPVRLDTVEVFPAERCVALVLRSAFRYRIRSGEKRMARLFQTIRQG